jgi:hypothetical protein
VSAHAPPWYRPPKGFEVYMPEGDYFSETPNFPEIQTAHAVARCVVRWADFCQAHQTYARRSGKAAEANPQDGCLDFR